MRIMSPGSGFSTTVNATDVSPLLLAVVRLAFHNTNLNRLVEGLALLLAPVHGNVHRAGFWKTAEL
jgi:hypothetical protein